MFSSSYRQFQTWQRLEKAGDLDYPSEPVGDVIALARSMRDKYAPLLVASSHIIQ